MPLKARPGRPIKSMNYRRQVTIYVDADLIELVDKKVRELRDVGDTSMSRSELYHRAIVKFLGI